jgi:hypothetical protein
MRSTLNVSGQGLHELCSSREVRSIGNCSTIYASDLAERPSTLARGANQTHVTVAAKYNDVLAQL